MKACGGRCEFQGTRFQTPVAGLGTCLPCLLCLSLLCRSGGAVPHAMPVSAVQHLVHCSACVGGHAGHQPGAGGITSAPSRWSVCVLCACSKSHVAPHCTDIAPPPPLPPHSCGCSCPPRTPRLCKPDCLHSATCVGFGDGSPAGLSGCSSLAGFHPPSAAIPCPPCQICQSSFASGSAGPVVGC